MDFSWTYWKFKVEQTRIIFASQFIAHDYTYINRLMISRIIIWKKARIQQRPWLENALPLSCKTLETFVSSSSLLETGSPPTCSEPKRKIGWPNEKWEDVTFVIDLTFVYLSRLNLSLTLFSLCGENWSSLEHSLILPSYNLDCLPIWECSIVILKLVLSVDDCID